MANHVSIKTFRNSLDEFADHIKAFYGHRYTLNGHKPKYDPTAWLDDMPSRSKGVESDLVVIFEDRKQVTARKPSRLNPKGRPVYNSIAFSFNQNEDDTSKMEVSFSMKFAGKIESGQFYSEDLFRKLIKEVNRIFRTEGEPKSRDELMKVLTIFWNNPQEGIKPLKPKKDLSELLGDDADKIPAMHKRIQHLKRENTTDFLAANKLRKEVETEIAQCQEAKEIAELEGRIKKLRSAMKKRKARLKDESGMTDLERKISEREKEIWSFSKKINETYARLKKHTPKSGPVRQALVDWFSKYL